MNNFEIFQEKSIKILGHDKPSQDEAKEHELAFFWSGVECKNGHLDYRRLVNRTCCQCVRESNRVNKPRESNPKIKKIKLTRKQKLEEDILRLKEARKKTEEVLYRLHLKQELGDLYDEDDIKYK